MTAEIHTALLRPSILQILRASGFNYARPGAVDTATDLAARYLLVLATTTAETAFNTHNDGVPTIQDVRIAMTENGALWPQMSTAEERLKGDELVVEGGVEMRVPFEDLRGVRGFVGWCQGKMNREIRRVAGVGRSEDGVVDVEQIAAGTDESVDYLSALKKSRGKTDEASDSRYQGTILGKENELQSVPIIGGPVNSISEWSAQFLKSRTVTLAAAGEDGDDEEVEVATPASSMLSEAPPTLGGEGEGDGEDGEGQTQGSLREGRMQTG